MQVVEGTSLRYVKPGTSSSRWKFGSLSQRLALAMVLALAAIFLHIWFDARAPGLTDAPGSMDEAVYVQSGYDYASDLHNGHPGKILHDRSIAEHPVFSRLLYASAMLADWAIHGYSQLPPQEQNRNYQLNFHGSPSFTRYLQDARIVSSICGIALVFLLALYSPLAGVFALLSTVVLTYTTRAYLEAPGMLCATAAVIVYLWAKERAPNLPRRSLVLSGVAVGLATAGKYYYVVAGVAIALDLLLFTQAPVRRRVLDALWIAGAALIAFSVADLPFYTQGIAKSLHLFQTHGVEYASGWSQTSTNLHRHWYSEISMLAQGFHAWYPSNHQPFLISIDPLIMALSLLGLVTAYRRHTVITLWLLSTLAFLILYPVKYEQYTCLAIVPVCLFATLGVAWLWSTIVGGSAELRGDRHARRGVGTQRHEAGDAQ